MKKIILFIILFLLVLPFFAAVQTNSTTYGSNVVISSGGVNVSSTTYNMDTVIGITIGDASSSSYNQDIGFFFGDAACVPTTCIILGYTCGNWSDGCSGTLDCGNCSSGYTCTAGTCVADTPVTPGGGTPTTPTTNIAVDPTEINLKLPVNREEVLYLKSIEQVVEVTNLGSTSVTVNLGYNGLSGIDVHFKDVSSLTLAGGETKSFTIVFTAGSVEDNFVGNIVVGTKQIPTSLDVGEFTLFDVNIVVLNKDYKVSQNSDLRTKVTLIPMGDPERLDVTLNYAIKSYDGEVYLTQSETVMVEKKIDFKKNFDTGSLPLGKYIVALELIYPGGVAPSSAHFEVVEKTATDFLGNIMLILLIAIILIAILIIILVIRRKRQQQMSVQ